MFRLAKRFGRLLPIILSLLLVNLAYAGVAGYDRGEPRALSGETIFRGLFYGQGPVAAMFPELWQSPQFAKYADRLDDADVIDMQNRLVDRLRAEDPTFFMDFAREMRSGEQLRIQKVMLSAAERLQKAAAAEIGVSPDALREDPTIGTYVATFVVVAVAVAVVVATVYVYITVEVDIIKQPEISPVGESNDLRSEMYIQMITDRLAFAE